MKRFDLIKSFQLLLLAALAVGALIAVLRDSALSSAIALGGSVRLLAVLLWLTLGVSFLFLLYDFNSYSELKRENLELDNAIYSDALTGIANRYSVDVYLAQFLNRPLPQDMGCVTLELTSLSAINASLGHGAGDAAIRDFSEILMNAANGICFIGRNGGNRFVAIFRDCTEARLQGFLTRLREGVDARNLSHLEGPLTYSCGTAFREGESVKSVTELVALSDRRAFQAAGGKEGD